MDHYSQPVQSLIKLLRRALDNATPVLGDDGKVKGRLLKSFDYLRLEERLADLTSAPRNDL